jgi:hypothetical protein
MIAGAATVVGGLAAAGVGAIFAKGRSARPGIFDRFHAGLVQVHGELRDAAAGIAATIPDAARDADTRAAILAFTKELLDHHKSEAAFFFPAFRAAGRMRSSDVAWLATKDEEHVAIHRICVELRDASVEVPGNPRTWRALVTAHVGTLAALSKPHFAEEEATLTPAHVATLLAERELAAVYRDMGRNWHRR